jgi:hypothetical protein
MIAAILLSIAGLIFLLWLLFTLAIYALPFYAGLSAAFYAYHHDAGVLGAGIIGLVTGVLTLIIGQFLFAVLRAPWSRALVAAIYALPAGVAGWYAVHGLFRAAGTGEPWLAIFAWTGAIVIAGIASVRVTALQPEIEAARARGAYLGRTWYSGAGDRGASLHQPPQERIENADRHSF